MVLEAEERGQAAQQPNPPSSDAQSMAPENSLSDGMPDYLQSDTFIGAFPGYAFKTGPKGVGYYLDNFSKQTTQEDRKDASCKATSSAQKGGIKLKPNNPIAKLKRPAAITAVKHASKQGSGTAQDPPKSKYLEELDRWRSQACTSETPTERPLVK